MAAVQQHIRMFDEVATEVGLTEKVRLNTYSKHTTTYDNLKKAIAQDAFARGDHAFLYSPVAADPLKAYQVALRVSPEAKEVAILRKNKSNTKRMHNSLENDETGPISKIVRPTDCLQALFNIPNIHETSGLANKFLEGDLTNSL